MRFFAAIVRFLLRSNHPHLTSPIPSTKFILSLSKDSGQARGRDFFLDNLKTSMHCFWRKPLYLNSELFCSVVLIIWIWRLNIV